MEGRGGREEEEGEEEEEEGEEEDLSGGSLIKSRPGTLIDKGSLQLGDFTEQERVEGRE